MTLAARGVAHAVICFCTGGARFVTGRKLLMDCGYMIPGYGDRAQSAPFVALKDVA